jgi:hypothetical protein
VKKDKGIFNVYKEADKGISNVYSEERQRNIQ